MEGAPTANYGHIQDLTESDSEDDDSWVGEVASLSVDHFWRHHTTRDKAALINVVFKCGNGEIKGIIDS